MAVEPTLLYLEGSYQPGATGWLGDTRLEPRESYPLDWKLLYFRRFKGGRALGTPVRGYAEDIHLPTRKGYRVALVVRDTAVYVLPTKSRHSSLIVCYPRGWIVNVHSISHLAQEEGCSVVQNGPFGEASMSALILQPTPVRMGT